MSNEKKLVLTHSQKLAFERSTSFLDEDDMKVYILKPYVYQWVYTAMTRARKELYVVKDFWLM